MMSYRDLWGFQLEPWIASAQKTLNADKELHGTLIVATTAEEIPDKVLGNIFEWQRAQLENPSSIVRTQTKQGPVWYIILPPEIQKTHHYGMFKQSPYQIARDTFGKVLVELCD